VLKRALDFFRGRIFCGKPEFHFSGKCSSGPSVDPAEACVSLVPIPPH
jgi:hypothetical protein